jgi:hypothetical protein
MWSAASQRPVADKTVSQGPGSVHGSDQELTGGRSIENSVGQEARSNNGNLSNQPVFRAALTVRNNHPYAVQFSLEPWADEVSMPPNGIFEIIATGPQGDCLEVMLGNDRITVYGWSGSVASVFNGREKVFDCQIPAPRLP